MSYGKVCPALFCLFRGWNGGNHKHWKKWFKAAQGRSPNFFFFTFLKRNVSWVGGRRSEIIPLHREIVEELWEWGKLSLLTDFTGIVVLHSWWRLTYKTPGKLADSFFTTSKIERKIWSSERMLSSEKLSAFYMSRLRKSCHHMLPCGNYIMALILVLVAWRSDAFISIIFILAFQKYMEYLLIGVGRCSFTF